MLPLPGAVWTDVDAARTGNLPFVFEPDMSFEKYVEYAMDVPMYFVYRNGQYINALGQSWRDFMEVRGRVALLGLAVTHANAYIL